MQPVAHFQGHILFVNVPVGRPEVSGPGRAASICADLCVLCAVRLQVDGGRLTGIFACVGWRAVLLVGKGELDHAGSVAGRWLRAESVNLKRV